MGVEEGAPPHAGGLPARACENEPTAGTLASPAYPDPDPGGAQVDTSHRKNLQYEIEDGGGTIQAFCRAEVLLP
jgi:hypothetical protein